MIGDDGSATSQRPARARLLIADDHRMLAHAFGLALSERGFEHVFVVEDVTERGIIAAAERFRPDVAVIDLHLDGRADSLGAIHTLTSRGVLVLAITGSGEPVDLGRCLEAGAMGVLEKTGSWDHLVGSISDLAMGLSIIRPAQREELVELASDRRVAEQRWRALVATLTPREREILTMLRSGLVAGEIARLMGVSVQTVRTHISSVLRKLGVSSQIAAVALANRSERRRPVHSVPEHAPGPERSRTAHRVAGRSSRR